MCHVANLHICNAFHKRWHLPSSRIHFALCIGVSGKLDFSKACNTVTDTACSGNAHNCRFHGLYFWLLQFTSTAGFMFATAIFMFTLFNARQCNTCSPALVLHCCEMRQFAGEHISTVLREV